MKVRIPTPLRSYTNDQSVVVAGGSVSAVAQELATAAVVEVITVEDAALGSYTPDGFVQALTTLIDAQAPEAVVLAHTYQTRDFAPMLAARLRRALVTDITGVKGSGASATFTRPMFQGKLAAEVRPRVPRLVPARASTGRLGARRGDRPRRHAARAGLHAPDAVTADSGIPRSARPRASGPGRRRIVAIAAPLTSFAS